MSSKHNSAPAAAVIVAVYNDWTWLRLVLDALRQQSVSDFEVVLADDGSNQATVSAIQSYINACRDMTVKHVYHEDMGFRKNRAMNRAVLATDAPYLIFIDGDCVPHPHFVADHLRLAKAGRIMAGRRFDLPMSLSLAMEQWPSVEGNFFWKLRLMVVRHGLDNIGRLGRQLRRSMRLPFLFGKPLSGLSRNWLLGCNFGITRADFMEVNGFDERFADPACGEDADLQVRLENAGKSIVKFANYALVAHKCHKRLFTTSSEHDLKLINEHRERKVSRAEVGIAETAASL